MGMTITEKILARHAGLDRVEPGQIIMAGLDLIMGHDVTAPPAIAEFYKAGFTKVRDPDKLALINDHFVPNKDVASAEQARVMRTFAMKHGIKNYFEVGRGGVCHVLVPDEGLVGPGDLVIGADSHTCTYGALGAVSTGVGSTDLAAAMATGRCWFRVPESIKFVYAGRPGRWVGGKDIILHTIGLIGVEGARYKAMEFTGDALQFISMAGRFTMANMAIEAGGKNGIFNPDRAVIDFVHSVGIEVDESGITRSDPDARYEKIININVSDLEPVVACPSLPSNIQTARELEGKGIVIDQAVIGSCTNGRIEDLREAAEVLKDRKAHKNVRLIVIPATQSVYRQALKEGLLEIFAAADAAVSTPTCGPCLGGHMGILARDETAISTTNRNFVGRMGHPKSKVYLSNPAVAAASAVAGRIVHPASVAGL